MLAKKITRSAPVPSVAVSVAAPALAPPPEPARPHQMPHYVDEIERRALALRVGEYFVWDNPPSSDAYCRRALRWRGKSGHNVRVYMATTGQVVVRRYP